MLRNGGGWQDLPDASPSESTCRRRLRDWTESGLLTEAWSRLVDLADEFGEIDWEPLIADDTFCRAKKRGDCVGIGRKGKGTTALVLMDGDRTPLGVVIASASEHEVRHVERLLDAAVVDLPRSAG